MKTLKSKRSLCLADGSGFCRTSLALLSASTSWRQFHCPISRYLFLYNDAYTVIVLFIQIYICSYLSTLPVRMSGSAPFLRIFVFSSLWFVIKNVIIPDLTKLLTDFLTWIFKPALSHVIGDIFFFPMSQRSVWSCWASCLYMMSSLFSSLLSSLRYVYLYFCFWSVSCF